MDPTLRCRGQKGVGVRSSGEKRGVAGPELLDLLGRCVIGWCRLPIPNRVLAAEMRAEGINEASVMHISGKRVLIIFDSIEERDHIVSSEVDLKVLDVVFPVRVSKVELFLRGPRVSRVVKGNRSDGSNSDSEDMMANSTANDVGNGLGRDRTVGECQGESWGAIHVAAAGETG
ncbi:hypothetical protein V6N11_052008 [Hibiscus sabdariffa]|uniref:Uncharacterized protein n=1 Tax=Hibiscus sabdariffa TaxID=183260 RepID=A0ABR2U8Q1_9ROSI